MPDRPNQEDLQLFEHEARQDSTFDPLQLRRNMWESLDTGSSMLLCKSCSNAKVLWIQPKGTQIEPPWKEWGRIFQWLGDAPGGVKWRVFWFPAPIPRILPRKGETVGPRHINGGYCYPCNPNVIVVYRLEEATRVLVHELLHASCTDPQGASLEIKEATTETWAELFLVALCSKGKVDSAKKLWTLQSQWISDQNADLRTKYHVNSPADYAWRYTLGREQILADLKVELPIPQKRTSLSSRLTHPLLCKEDLLHSLG